MAANGKAPRCSIRFARLERELIKRLTHFTPACSSSPFRCASRAHCGAFVDERRIVVGDAGGRMRTRNAALAEKRRWVVGAGFQRTRFSRSSRRQTHLDYRRSIRLARLERELIRPRHTGRLIAALQCDAPALSSMKRPIVAKKTRSAWWLPVGDAHG
jgi:hypothetical protein